MLEALKKEIKLADNSKNPGDQDFQKDAAFCLTDNQKSSNDDCHKYTAWIYSQNVSHGHKSSDTSHCRDACDR